MSQFTSLLKASMSGGLQLFNYRGNSERSKRMTPLLLGVLMGLLMLFSSSVMVMELKRDGAETVILSVYTLVTTIIIIMEGSYKAIDLLFRPRDNDVLLSMPIPKSTIILTRLLKFYLFEMVYCLIFLLPAIIAYALNVNVDMSYYLVSLTMLLLVPVIPIALACIIGLVIAAVSGRFKHKTFWQITLSFIVMFGSVGLVFLLNTNPDINTNGLVMLGSKITEYYYPTSTFVKLVTDFNTLDLLVFIVINLLILALTTLIISHFCFRIITRIGTMSQTTKTVSNYHYPKHSQTMTMVKKELNRYFNTPVLLMNTAMGLVFFIIAVGLLCFKFDDAANSFISSVEEFPLALDEIRSFLPGVTFAMVAFASLLTCITATMISLEGKAFNALKSLPISGIKVIMTKVLTAMLLITPITTTGSLIMAIRFQFGIIETILVLIGVIVMPLVTELIGILINLKYPRFDADNDTVVVRQSASVMIATFLGLGMVLITISLVFATVFMAGQITGLLILDTTYAIISLFLYFVVAMRGEEIYLKLNA